jgi:hypothetical protein
MNQVRMKLWYSTSLVNPDTSVTMSIYNTKGVAMEWKNIYINVVDGAKLMLNVFYQLPPPTPPQNNTNRQLQAAATSTSTATATANGHRDGVGSFVQFAGPTVHWSDMRIEWSSKNDSMIRVRGDGLFSYYTLVCFCATLVIVHSALLTFVLLITRGCGHDI